MEKSGSRKLKAYYVAVAAKAVLVIAAASTGTTLDPTTVIALAGLFTADKGLFDAANTSEHKSKAKMEAAKNGTSQSTPQG